MNASLGVVETMGKKKAAKIGRPPLEEGPRKQILTLRGREEFKAWVMELAEFDRSDMADLIDNALTVYAKSIGFKNSPPRR